MAKYNYYFTFGLLLTTFLSNGQITFNKTYNYGVDNSFDVLETPTGYLPLIISGYPFYPKKIQYTHLDFMGDTIFSKAIGDSFSYHANYSMLAVNDSKYVTGAYKYNPINQRYTIELMKLNTLGDTIWVKEHFASNNDGYFAAYTTLMQDGGFLITGERCDSTVTFCDALAFRTDSSGNKLWEVTYGGNSYDNFYSSVELPDKSLLLCGWTRKNIQDRQIYLVKTDSMGNFIWSREYGGPNDDLAVGITPLANGNFMLASGHANATIGNGWLIEVDTSGAIVRQRQYLTASTILTDLWWARELPNGDIVAVGSNRVGAYDAGYIFCTDSLLNLKWDRNFDYGPNHDYFRNIKLTSDGGFIICGFVLDGLTGSQDAWLVKLDSLGCDSVGCPTYYTAVEDYAGSSPAYFINAYPNPAKDLITIETMIPEKNNYYTLQITDAMGRMIDSYALNHGLNKTEINIKDFSPGLYFYSLLLNNHLLKTIKFVKQ